ncbi:MAG: UDP-glucose--hexose-1-phosphate uridylyltransferase [Streptococcaceae bacterium]|jgi:UDPglucose--hexose-1-phosphate uridylyltransferase|nr:UDP-glucose--hexose-1-phosphate uridylyltransferase [Streptococcaceae bacterium]
MSIYQKIQDFVKLAIANGSIEAIDEIYLRNRLLHFLSLSDWSENVQETNLSDSLEIMDELLNFALKKGVFKAADTEFYESALMNFITPLPSKVNHVFWKKYQQSPESATNYFYDLAKQVNQVKTREIAKNIEYLYPSTYGDLQITINLSKPEKDPKAIAAAKLIHDNSYPKCALCIENEGFYGNGNKAARSNHRIVRLELNDEKWGFQYSPYAYFNEHSIVLNEKHQPMAIDHRCFSNLMAFLDLFPHYMIGSNADLPIVGGSILTHDHYQAGRHEFPMAKAALREKISLDKFPEIEVGIVNWPMSVLRLSSRNSESIVAASDEILAKWREYNDLSLSIRAQSSDGTLHHTITPIARKRGDFYEMDLVLRDNNVSETFPDGIFHPHAELHHIKKENIGLIEAMGLAILPARLVPELAEVEKYLLGKENQMDEIHKAWADQLKATDQFSVEDVHYKVGQAVGEVFTKVLQDAGVFKDDESGHAGFHNFIDFINS